MNIERCEFCNTARLEGRGCKNQRCPENNPIEEPPSPFQFFPSSKGQINTNPNMSFNKIFGNEVLSTFIYAWFLGITAGLLSKKIMLMAIFILLSFIAFYVLWNKHVNNQKEENNGEKRNG